MKPRVFITQETTTADFRPALEYGDLIVCLPPGRASLSPIPTIRALRDKLHTFTDSDYIVPTGDPAVIAIAACVASEANDGKFKMLKWDRIAKRYIEVQINLKGGSYE